MEHEKILKLVEKCASELTPDKIEGIKKLENQFKEDPNTLKAILGLIALSFPEHSDFIVNYLRVGFSLSNPESKLEFEEHIKHYPSLRNVIISKLDLIGLQLNHYKYEDAEKNINHIIEYSQDLLHSISTGTKPTKSYKKGKLFDEIHAFQIKLNRLSDFVVISDQDKILKEMAALQSSMRNLGTLIQEHIQENF